MTRTNRLGPESLKSTAIPDRTDQADSRARPLLRRDLMMARPERVDMRCRKPCFLARLRTLGWKVRFTMNTY